MKKLLALVIIALTMVLMLGVMSAAAAPSAIGNTTDPADTVISAGDNANKADGSAEIHEDGIVEEEDMVIDLQLVTTLVISICSVLTVGVIAAVVYLGNKNRG